MQVPEIIRPIYLKDLSDGNTYVGAVDIKSTDAHDQFFTLIGGLISSIKYSDTSILGNALGVMTKDVAACGSFWFLCRNGTYIIQTTNYSLILSELIEGKSRQTPNHVLSVKAPYSLLFEMIRPGDLNENSRDRSLDRFSAACGALLGDNYKPLGFRAHLKNFVDELMLSHVGQVTLRTKVFGLSFNDNSSVYPTQPKAFELSFSTEDKDSGKDYHVTFLKSAEGL